MKIVSFNLRVWYRDTRKSYEGYWKDRAKAICEYLTKQNPDIIMIQEGLYPMVGKCIPSGYKKATGCSVSHHIYCRKDYKVINHEWHMRWCHALVELPGGRKINAFSVHTHWDKSIYEKTCTEITSHLEFGIENIAGGDWNNEPDVIAPLVKPMCIAKTNHPTFCNWDIKNTAELDYFAIWPMYSSFAVDSYSGPVLSDHIPITLYI